MTNLEASNQKEILKNVDDVIARGPYTDTWDSLSSHSVPTWYQDAKFGIFIHWGVYSVPAFGNEWYPRRMYIKGTPEYVHHREVYGDQKTFGYKDFIPMFKAEKFDASKWVDLFSDAGARYIMPVAEHHDGFQMYKSRLSRWNAYEMGPERDVIGELRDETEKRGLIFACSDHRAEHSWFFNGGTFFDSDVSDPEYESFYGKQQYCDEARVQDIYACPPEKGHMENWLARACEIVDSYHPKIMWFDCWIQNIAWKPYLRKFAAYYYNRANEWGEEVTINYKYDAFVLGSGVCDIERGSLNGINPYFWQNDTAIAKNSWCYTEHNEFKTPEEIVADLVDIVSKNGCLLLNVGPKSDGTFTDEDINILRSIGKWLKVNGTGIYGTRPWKVFGEGPTEKPAGYFTDINQTMYTSGDIRFTQKGSHLYAFVMKYPDDGKVTIKSLGRNLGGVSETPVLSVSMLGGEKCPFVRDEQGLHIKGQERPATHYPVCFQIEID